ncbi:hypothetical protein LL240_13770 [Oceanimonas baumannii]|nr:hypothetical protein [Oceanimonas baumannii]MCC4265513.1 hypothetical protein [Oceanimonas baumannii]
MASILHLPSWRENHYLPIREMKMEADWIERCLWLLLALNALLMLIVEGI